MESKNRILVQLYTKEDCSLCTKALAIIEKVARDIPVHLEKIDITEDKKIFEKFKEKIPVVFIGNKMAFKYIIDEIKLREKLLRCK
ncbi:glutaredoxin family protein [candidate division KSB1 bacterium]|nr:glutaredoxin family protein [candidate division KSB1 bacterium]